MFLGRIMTASQHFIAGWSHWTLREKHFNTNCMYSTRIYRFQEMNSKRFLSQTVFGDQLPDNMFISVRQRVEMFLQNYSLFALELPGAF